MAETIVSRDGFEASTSKLTSTRTQQTRVVLPFTSPSRRPCRCEGRREGEANGGLSQTSFKKGKDNGREPQMEAITRTRVVRASSSATWDQTVSATPSGIRTPDHVSSPDGAALTLSNDPQGLCFPTISGCGCSDRRMGFPRCFPKSKRSQNCQ